MTTSPNVNKRTNVKLEGIDVGSLRGPLFKTAERGNYPKSHNTSVKGTIQTTEPDAMSSPMHVEKLRATQKSMIT